VLEPKLVSCSMLGRSVLDRLSAFCFYDTVDEFRRLKFKSQRGLAGFRVLDGGLPSSCVV
jgi:hypothetical protein